MDPTKKTDPSDHHITKKQSPSSEDGVLHQSYDEPPNKVPTTRGEAEERRMEVNRMRAKQIRKRKKKMEEDMQKQVIQLTLENNKLRTQLKIQETEISLLRSQVSGNNIGLFSIGTMHFSFSDETY